MYTVYIIHFIYIHLELNFEDCKHKFSRLQLSSACCPESTRDEHAAWTCYSGKVSSQFTFCALMFYLARTRCYSPGHFSFDSLLILPLCIIVTSQFLPLFNLNPAKLMERYSIHRTCVLFCSVFSFAGGYCNLIAAAAAAAAAAAMCLLWLLWFEDAMFWYLSQSSEPCLLSWDGRQTRKTSAQGQQWISTCVSSIGFPSSQLNRSHLSLW